MLNFAEQTGSGAVMLVWSFLPLQGCCCIVSKSIFEPFVVLTRVFPQCQDDTVYEDTTEDTHNLLLQMKQIQQK
jgi:hypothetical protein